MYIIVSFSHQNTSVEVRERLHFSDEESIKILPILKEINGVSEIMLLSTCNRCEIYAYINHNNSNEKLQNLDSINLENITKEMITTIANYKNVDINELANPEILRDKEAIRHIFCVASALVSLVVGESQISGQLKDAFKLSSENNFSGKWLNRLISFAFRCAASVRSQTDIAKNPVSIASIMATLALEFIESKAIKSPKILIIGVGEMGKLSLKHLAKHKLNLTLSNRTAQNAQNLLQSLESLWQNQADSIESSAKKSKSKKPQILDFSQMQNALNDYHIVISAVSGGVIITENMLKKRKFDRIFFDLSIPRNISFGSHSFGSTAIKVRDKKLKNILQNIDVVCVDDLKLRAARHIESRRENLAAALKIVDKFVLDFASYLNNLELDPLIKKMRFKAKLASLKEINRAIKKGYLPEALRENITRLAHGIFNEFLHAPTMNLRTISEEAGADNALESIARFFGD